MSVINQENVHKQYNICVIICSPRRFGAYCAIFRQKFFVYARKLFLRFVDHASLYNLVNTANLVNGFP